MRIARLRLGLGLLVVASASLGAGAPLSMQAPTVMLAPGHLVVEAVVEPDPANRSIEVIAESADLYQSSEVQLDGESAPRKHTFEFKDLPSGTYEIHVELLGRDGQQRALVVQDLAVISRAR